MKPHLQKEMIPDMAEETHESTKFNSETIIKTAQSFTENNDNDNGNSSLQRLRKG